MHHHSQLPAMPLAATMPGHRQRRIGRKRRGHHRGAGQPPGHIAPRKKELTGAAAGAAGVIEGDAQVEREVSRDNDPIQYRELHEGELVEEIYGKRIALVAIAR